MVSLDAIIKGVLVDILESFQTNLWTCKPAKTWVNGMCLLVIRAFSTYILVWAAITLVKRRWLEELPPREIHSTPKGY